MEIDNLIKMANQIARFFEAWPDRAAASQEVADHLCRFWTPRMRAALVTYLATHDDRERLNTLVADAAALLRK